MSQRPAKQLITKQQRITVFIGYGLFFITVIGILVSLAQQSGAMPTVQDIQRNVIATMLAFAFTTILPPLVGYFIGEWATRNKPKLIHHYNGVLFGILGFWIATILSSLTVFIPSSLSLASHLVITSAPALLAVVLLTVVAIFYARSTKQQVSLMSYTPYQVAFISAVGSVFLVSATSMLSGLSFGADFFSSFAVLILPALMIALVLCFGAVLLGAKNGSFTQRLIKSMVVFSFAVIAGTALVPLLAVIQALSIAGQWSFVLGVAVWIICIVLFRRTATIQH